MNVGSRNSPELRPNSSISRSARRASSLRTPQALTSSCSLEVTMALMKVRYTLLFTYFSYSCDCKGRSLMGSMWNLSEERNFGVFWQERVWTQVAMVQIVSIPLVDIDWIHKSKDFVRRLDKEGRKVIGICFGHQVIAEALQGKVHHHVSSAIPLQFPVNASLPSQTKPFRYLLFKESKWAPSSSISRLGSRGVQDESWTHSNCSSSRSPWIPMAMSLVGPTFAPLTRHAMSWTSLPLSSQLTSCTRTMTP